MADFRKSMPDRLVQIQRRALASIGDLGTAAISVDHPIVMDTHAIGVAVALEKAAADIRVIVARAEAEGRADG